MTDEIIAKLEHILGKGTITVNKQLFPYISLKTQAVARFFFEAETKNDLINVQRASRLANIPLIVMGGGSNLALLTKNIKCLVVKNLYKKKQKIANHADFVEVQYSSGYPVSQLVAETTAAGYKGFEYHLGLPGTVGGALYMNSKWTRPLSYFGDHLVQADIVNQDGRVKTVDHSYFQFAYDYSILQKTKEVVLDALFRLKKADPVILKTSAKHALEYRKKTQPFGVFSSGCFFRNISKQQQKKLGVPTTSAGYLIDRSGMKGYSVGNFTVSEKHANFIINKGKGAPDDLKKLLAVIKARVRSKFGIELKEEVIII